MLTTDKSGQAQQIARTRAFSGTGLPENCRSTEKLQAINRNILALDLGTKTGWAVATRDGLQFCGTESFTPRARWTPGQRWLRFRAWLVDLLHKHDIHALAYERVVFGHSSAASSDVYGAFKCLVELTVEGRNIELLTVAVPTVKKHWTGSGRADKAAMVAEAKRRGFRPDSDNAADALAVLDWAIAQEAA